jgi:Domain of unknown function (DUF4178)
MLWILIGVVAMASGGFIAYRAGRAKGIETALPAAGGGSRLLLERTIKDVRVDDIVQHGGKDWLVEGIVTYDEDGHTWRAARCIDAPDERWWLIGLERIGMTTVRLMARAKGLALSGYPPETLTYEGVSYKLQQRGTATTVLMGQFSDIPGVKGVARNVSLRCRWWRYGAAGEKTLLVEQWGEDYVALVGEQVKPEDVDLLSAS